MVDIQMVSQLWADVKYHVPTGIGFRRRRDIPLAYFQCNDKLQLVSKHAKGISLRYDAFFHSNSNCDRPKLLL